LNDTAMTFPFSRKQCVNKPKTARRERRSAATGHNNKGKKSKMKMTTKMFGSTRAESRADFTQLFDLLLAI
jgi:hypothetical protein